MDLRRFFVGRTIGLLAVLVFVGGFFLFNHYIYREKQGEIQTPEKDFKNISYEIDGQSFALVDGRSEVEAAPGSASKIVTEYFGNEVRGDFTGDGREDIAFLLTQNGGGSGTFYYVVAALKKNIAIKEGDQSIKYFGTNAILLGDRIAPQTTEFRDGQIIVNYADRKANEPMATQPSVGVSRYFKIENDKLIEYKRDVLPVTNFEECAAQGNPIMESYPRQCRADGKTFTEVIAKVTMCPDSSRNVDACITIYKPVCAKVNIQCIKAPCYPVKQTFGNSCEACTNPLAESYTEGECAPTQ